MSSLTSQPNEDLTSRCPEAVSLRSFLDGRLSEEQCDTIALHLEGCATCLAVITELEQNNARRPPSEKFPEAGSTPEDSDGLARAVARAIDASSVAPLVESRFRVGMVVGSYRLVQRLGSGGMGVVFLAEHETMRRRVALKVLVGRLQDDPESTRRFVQEIRTSAKLDHPRFVKSLDAGELNGSPYLVMDYLEGVSLAMLSRCWGRVSLADACEIARQVAEGLQVLADHKLVHRDLKPSNVMLVLAESSTESDVLESGPTVKILDFGVARWQESAGMTQAVTLPSFVVGTLEYMAPEQLEASSQVDERADWYSLGATLFKLLIGAAPLELSGLSDASPIAKATHLKTESVPPIRSLRRDVPRAVARIVDRLLSRDPAQRPSPSEVQRVLSPYAVDADLPRLLKERPENANPTLMTPPRTSRLRLWKRTIQRNTRWIAVAVTLLFGTIVFATNYGELSIDVLDEDTTVVVSRGGKVIEIIDTREKRRVRLRPDKYELTLENSEKHDLVLSTNQVTIRRGTTEIAHVKLQPPPIKPTAATSRRNPFGLDVDVPDTPALVGPDVTRFAEQGFLQLPGGSDDANAKPWTSFVAQGSADTITGEWRSRWKCSDPKHEGWHEGPAQVQIVGDRVFILHREQHTDYLIEARREGDRLLGRYINLRGTYRHDSFPWIGRFIGNDRIDGLWGMPQKDQWFNRRWDLRRSFVNDLGKAPPQVTPGLPARGLTLRFSDDFNGPGRGWVVDRKADREFGFRNGCYFIQSPSPNGFWAWGAMPVFESVDIELIGRVVEATNGAWGLRVENSVTPKDGFYVGVTGKSEVVLGIYNELAAEQPVTVNIGGQDASLSISQPLKIRPISSVRPVGEFNTLRISVDRQTVQVFVNGERVCEPFTLPKAISPVAMYLAVFLDGPPGVNAEFDRVRLWTAGAAPVLP